MYRIALLVIDEATGEYIFDTVQTGVAQQDKAFELAQALYAEAVTHLSDADKEAMSKVGFAGA